jgi:transposase
MSKARLIITAVVVEGRSQADVARSYGVSPGWVSKLAARYRSEGEAAFEPRSRRPKTSPRRIPTEVAEAIVELRRTLVASGHDAGPETIRWHLLSGHGVTVSRSTISRYLVEAGLVEPQPAKRPRSFYIRFQADQPNECWQSDVTHWDLAPRHASPGEDAEILTSSGTWRSTRPGITNPPVLREVRRGPANPRIEGSRVSYVLRHHMVGTEGVEPATF